MTSGTLKELEIATWDEDGRASRLLTLLARRVCRTRARDDNAHRRAMLLELFGLSLPFLSLEIQEALPGKLVRHVPGDCGIVKPRPWAD